MTHFDDQYGSEKAVLWAFSSYDADGIPVLSAAVEITVVGWNEGSQEAVGPDGSPISVDGSCHVLQHIAEGSYLRQGNLRDLPATPNNLREVVSYRASNDLKGSDPIHVVAFVRRNTLPTV